MPACYIGRGSLLVSVLGASGGFFTLSAESELTAIFEEDNESVFDARHGVNERVDWYVRNRRMRLEAQCFRIEKDSLELLLKSNYSLQAAGSGAIELETGVVVGRAYPLKPNITGTPVVTDDVAAVVPDSKYSIDEKYGLISFSDIAGYTQPFTVTADWDSHEAFALHSKTQTLCKARFHGVNKVTEREVMAEFYRLALDITEELKLVQKPFSSMGIRMHGIPDASEPLDAALGQYGRIILL